MVQAADLIGQLGDPLYLKKANALFREFEEIGLNRQLGYASPADLVECYPDFYWSSVSSHLEEAIAYLNVTAAGRQWIANLHSHVFCAQHALPSWDRSVSPYPHRSGSPWPNAVRVTASDARIHCQHPSQIPRSTS